MTSVTWLVVLTTTSAICAFGERWSRQRGDSRFARGFRAGFAVSVVLLLGFGAWAVIFAIGSDSTENVSTVDWVLFTLSDLVLVGLTMFAYGLLKDRARRSRYASLQAGRPPITDEEFCRRAGLSPAAEGLVEAIRPALAARGRGMYDAARIYPDDEFYGPFDLGYDDDQAWFVERANLIPGFRADEGLPHAAFPSVADFVQVVQGMKDEAGAS